MSADCGIGPVRVVPLFHDDRAVAGSSSQDRKTASTLNHHLTRSVMRPADSILMPFSLGGSRPVQRRLSI